ncbi:MAG: short-chain dehydrogenase [Pseudooceanicola sp.]|nr:short-chain dehydrogenase [Pseudooceanicola sp.]
MTPFDLEGKTAIITGSSRGIGKSIAEAMAIAGANVVISSRRQDSCEATAASINELAGRDAATPIAASISSREELETLVATTQDRVGPVDILVCNAATNPYYGPMAGISDDAFRKVFDNNVLSNHWLIKMVAPSMAQRGGGTIIVVSSIGGMLGSDTIGAYNITKAAEFQLVRNLAVELGPNNIRVNAIAPGVIRTDFAKALWENPKAEASLKKTTPLGRIGEPADIAGAAVFLASPASRHVTGQSLVIDGGFTVSGGM